MRIAQFFTLLTGTVFLCACTGNNAINKAAPKSSVSHISNKVKFSSASYGVAASPRITTSRKVRKGGGRRQIGRPYKIKGRWYTPKEELGYDRKGRASWYGPNFHGRLTANGEIYDQYALTAAHPTFPLPSYARVTNLANGRSVIVRVNDRGPYHPGRVIDLSARASELLDYQQKGVADVRVQYIKQAPLHGLDHKLLAASYQQGTGSAPVVTALTAQAKAPKFKRLDAFSTGSVNSSGEERDPFLAEIDAIKSKTDTGTTLALRLRNQFILDGK